MAETPTNSALLMDRGFPLGNSEDRDTRRALHVKIKNTDAESIPFSPTPNQFSPPLNADSVKAEYPTTTTELYKYYQGGLTGTLLKTIRVTYTTSSKKILQSVEVL